jgi:succinate dehydrogenase (ubiquinone) flavoprotein subunit
MARPLSRVWGDFASVFRASANASNGLSLPRSSRSSRWRRDVFRRDTQQRRTYLGHTQRRRATTSAETNFNHPVIDHHYEFVVQDVVQSRSQAKNVRSAIVVGAGGAGLRAAVGLAESGELHYILAISQDQHSERDGVL